MAEKSRWEEIKEIWRNADYRVFYKVLGWTTVILILLLIGREFYAHVPTEPNQGEIWGYGINVFTSILSTVFTVTVLDILNRKRTEDELKRQLVIDAASISNEFAKNAVHQLWRRKWLRTGDDLGLLNGRDLTSASLQDAVLMDADMQEADLTTANLQHANLIRANLRSAILNHAILIGAWLNNADLRQAALVDAHLQKSFLIEADLRWANLFTAKLQEANLTVAKLQGARMEFAILEKAVLTLADLQRTRLDHANLRGANLTDANLQDAKLVGTKFDEATTLPDGNLWKQNTDMRRFTDPTYLGPHGEKFWRSSELASPAYSEEHER